MDQNPRDGLAGWLVSKRHHERPRNLRGEVFFGRSSGERLAVLVLLRVLIFLRCFGISSSVCFDVESVGQRLLRILVLGGFL